MKKLYVCSPYAGDIPRNKQYARDLTRYAVYSGYAPITPHLYITEAVDDKKTDERDLGLSVAIELLRGCDALLLGCDYGITPGMRTELEYAAKFGIPIVAAFYETISINGLSKRVVKSQAISGGAI